MRSGSLVLGGLILALGLALVRAGLALPSSPNPDDVPAGYLPAVVGAVLASLSLILVWHNRRARAEDKGFRHGFAGRSGAFLAGAVAYVAAMHWVGYLVPTVTFMIAAVLLVEGRRAWWLASFTGAGFALFVAAVFQGLLGVPLP